MGYGGIAYPPSFNCHNCHLSHHSLCHEIVVLQSFLQVLHSEQLLSSLLAEMLIGEVVGDGSLP